MPDITLLFPFAVPADGEMLLGSQTDAAAFEAAMAGLQTETVPGVPGMTDDALRTSESEAATGSPAILPLVAMLPLQTMDPQQPAAGSVAAGEPAQIAIPVTQGGELVPVATQAGPTSGTPAPDLIDNAPGPVGGGIDTEPLPSNGMEETDPAEKPSVAARDTMASSQAGDAGRPVEASTGEADFDTADSRDDRALRTLQDLSAEHDLDAEGDAFVNTVEPDLTAAGQAAEGTADVEGPRPDAASTKPASGLNDKASLALPIADDLAAAAFAGQVDARPLRPLPETGQEAAISPDPVDNALWLARQNAPAWAGAQQTPRGPNARANDRAHAVDARLADTVQGDNGLSGSSALTGAGGPSDMNIDPAQMRRDSVLSSLANPQMPVTRQWDDPAFDAPDSMTMQIGESSIKPGELASTARQQPSEQPLPPRVPVADQVMTAITHAREQGQHRITVNLHPAELGSVEISIDMAADGSMQAHILVERKETFELMQRDAGALSQRLSDAGIDLAGGDLQFSMSQQGEQGDAGQGDGRERRLSVSGDDAPQPDRERPHATLRGLVDLSV